MSDPPTVIVSGQFQYWASISMILTTSRQARFALAGVAATSVHYLVMAALIAGEINSVVASVIGAGVGAWVNYWLQFVWTFRSSRPHRDAVAAYCVVGGVSWLLNGVLFYLMSDFLQMSAVPAQLSTTALLAVINYILYRDKVFI